MSAFAGKQTFKIVNSNVRFILKADIRVGLYITASVTVIVIPTFFGVVPFQPTNFLSRLIYT